MRRVPKVLVVSCYVRCIDMFVMLELSKDRGVRAY